MSEPEIKDNPTLRNLQENVDSFEALWKLWSVLKPLAKAFKVDTRKIDEALDRVPELSKQVKEMTTVPDRFNDLFAESGWIFFESMELDAGKDAIAIAETEGLEKANEFLADHFSPDWVESRINWLKYIKGFQPRFELAKKALADYKAGRYYASVLVTLALMDGWVSELNIVDFKRLGFFAEKSSLTAWDSIASHPKGLMALKETFSKPRKTTRTEEIHIPYRHGIVHGFDLGYDNKYVAAKCWAALFTVREWVIKHTWGELQPPALSPAAERTLWESIERYRKVREETERIRQWTPRRIVIGETVPVSGRPSEYPEGSPEQVLVEFLEYWAKANYGFMANCYAPMLAMKPADVRESFADLQLVSYELQAIRDELAFITAIEVFIRIRSEGGAVEAVYEFRLACNSPDGELAYIQSEGSVWGITTWRRIA